MKYPLLLFISIFFIHSAKAQWNSDTTVRNIICSAKNSQQDQRICSDGNSGAYIAWDDSRGTYQRVYMQHIDSAGDTQWQTNGIAINDTTILGGANDPDITPDGKGGVFIIWSRGYYSDTYILAQHINSSGTLIWKNTLRIDTVDDARNPTLTPDGHGGAIINWYAYTPGNDQIYIQWIDSTGRLRFKTQFGLQVSLGTGAHYSSFAATDNNYNAYIIFPEYDTIREVKIDTAGNFIWGQKGRVLTTTYYNNSDPNIAIASDGKGNVTTVWWDDRRYPLVSHALTDLFGQSVNAAGTFLWNAAGEAIDTSSKYNNNYFAVTSDENGGAYAVFGSGEQYLQHISANGTLSFSTPKNVTTNNRGQSRPVIVADGHSGAIVAWDDGRGEPNVYAMRFDSIGNYLWQPAGAPVYAGPLGGGSASGARIISLGNGNAIAAMDIGGDIIAARFTGTTYATAVKEISNTDKQWSVYPNPANGVVYLKNISGQSAKANVQLFNGIGQLISSEYLDSSSSNPQAINVGSTQGVYFLKITSNNSVSTYSLIVQ